MDGLGTGRNQGRSPGRTRVGARARPQGESPFTQAPERPHESPPRYGAWRHARRSNDEPPPHRRPQPQHVPAHRRHRRGDGDARVGGRARFGRDHRAGARRPGRQRPHGRRSTGAHGPLGPARRLRGRRRPQHAPVRRLVGLVRQRRRGAFVGHPRRRRAHHLRGAPARRERDGARVVRLHDLAGRGPRGRRRADGRHRGHDRGAATGSHRPRVRRPRVDESLRRARRGRPAAVRLAARRQ